MCATLVVYSLPPAPCNLFPLTLSYKPCQVSRELEKECIVVFDEAHNIDNVCIEALSVNMRQQTLDAAGRNLTRLRNVRGRGGGMRNFISILLGLSLSMVRNELAYEPLFLSIESL